MFFISITLFVIIYIVLIIREKLIRIITFIQPCNNGAIIIHTIIILITMMVTIIMIMILQLCAARSAWFESDQAVRTVHSCNSW